MHGFRLREDLRRSVKTDRSDSKAKYTRLGRSKRDKKHREESCYNFRGNVAGLHRGLAALFHPATLSIGTSASSFYLHLHMASFFDILSQPMSVRLW